MTSKTIAHIVHLLAMFVAGFTMANIGLNFRDKRYWILLFMYIIVYICGYVQGG